MVTSSQNYGPASYDIIFMILKMTVNAVPVIHTLSIFRMNDHNHNNIKINNEGIKEDGKYDEYYKYNRCLFYDEFLPLRTGYLRCLRMIYVENTYECGATATGKKEKVK